MANQQKTYVVQLAGALAALGAPYSSIVAANVTELTADANALRLVEQKTVTNPFPWVSVTTSQKHFIPWSVIQVKIAAFTGIPLSALTVAFDDTTKVVTLFQGNA